MDLQDLKPQRSFNISSFKVMDLERLVAERTHRLAVHDRVALCWDLT